MAHKSKNYGYVILICKKSVIKYILAECIVPINKEIAKWI